MDIKSIIELNTAKTNLLQDIIILMELKISGGVYVKYGWVN